MKDAPLDVDRVPARAFALAEELAPGPGEWHAHGRHQLLYARAGTLVLEVEEASAWLPPQRAAWIAAGVPHRVDVRRAASLRTSYLDPALVPDPPTGCRVFTVTPLLAEMLVAATRWDAEHPGDALSDAFFRALAGLCAEQARASALYRLPRAKSPDLALAMRWAREHLAEEVGLDDAARAAGVSPRTLRRRFREEVGLGWSEYRLAARMLAAMEALAADGATVTDTAREVGYRSLGAFSDAFLAFTGERPAAYQRRVRST